MVVFLVTLCVGAPAARAVDARDQQDIASLRRIFGIDSTQATDGQLTQLLDAPRVGPSLRGDIDCAYLGEHALDASSAERVELEALLSEYESVLAADQFLDPLIVGTFGDTVATEFIVGLHGSLGQLHSAISTFVDAEAYLESDGAYRSWLSQYHGDVYADGMSPAEAREDIEETAGGALAAVTQPRRLTRDQLFAGLQYASGCMELDANPEIRQGFANEIIGIVGAIHGYETGSDLAIVPVAEGVVEVINSGDTELEDVVLKDSGGGAVGGLGFLEAGEDSPLGLNGSPGEVEFGLFGVPGVKADYATIERPLFVGNAVTRLAASSPKTGEFELDQGPFAAAGSSPEYKWSFSDGVRLTGAKVTREFSCYGEQFTTFTAIVGGETIKRSAQLDVPPPFTVDWTTSAGEYAVAPEVPITFTADSSIPAGESISWNFGDGQSAQGREVTHTFASGGVEDVTMGVNQTNCPQLRETHKVLVGRSDTWVPLSGSLGDRTLRSSVAGYVITGPATIGKGRTVTVEPGTNVKFTSLGSSEPGQLLVEGKLRIEGASGAPAVFTSRYDDSAGGHCTCAPTGHTAAGGDWYGITLLNDGTVEADHADVRYANHALDLQSSSAHLSVFESVLSNSGVGVYSGGENDILVESSRLVGNSEGALLECFACSYTPRLRNLEITGGSVGVWAKGSTAALIEGTTFAGVPQDVLLDSTATRTRVRDTRSAGEGGYITVSEGFFPWGVVRLDSDLPYAFTGAMTVSTSTQLALAPGAVVKFRPLSPERGRLDVLGSLVSSGTVAEPVVLTSVNDDAAGGHCGCARSGSSPAVGDWWGVVLHSGAAATLDHTIARYAGADIELQSGSAALLENSTFSDAGTGVMASGPASLTVAGSDASRNSNGMRFECSGCSFAPHLVGDSFESNSTAVTVTGRAAPRIRASQLATSNGFAVANSGSASVDARGNWWGSASGPAPTGTGSRISGAVEYQPFCLAPVSSCTSVALTATRTTIAADGRATTTVTASVNDPTGPVAGQHVYLTSTDPGQALGAVTDNGDGTYTATITASRRTGDATVRVVDTSLSPAPEATITITETAPEVLLSLAPSSIAGDGESQATATVKVSSAGEPLSGESIGLTSSDPGETIGPVTDNGDGTYTATITASTTPGTATITAQDSSVEPAALATGQLAQAATTEIGLALAPPAIFANHTATSVAVVTLASGGAAVVGHEVRLTSSDPGETIGPVTDNGDGTYTATIRASKTPGTATITATDASDAGSPTASAILRQANARRLRLSLAATRIVANGRASTIATVKVTAGAEPLSGESIGLTSSDPGETIGPVTDNGDGTYTATITASTTPGTATITATDHSEGLDLAVAASLRQRIPKLTLSLKPTRVPSNGRASTTATVKVTAGAEPLSGESIGLTSSDPGETIGPVTDNGDGTYTATITASTTPGTATITATDHSEGLDLAVAASLRQRIPKLTLSLKPTRVPSNGRASTTATVTVTAGAEPLSGESIGLTSSDPGETIGPVTDNGDGTYTATITASTTPGTATITASDPSVGTSPSKTAKLRQRLLVLALSLSPRTVPANGQATTEAKVKVSSAGEPLSGESIGLTSSDPGETIGPVTDNGDGTYTATITASTTPGTATITATDHSEGLDLAVAASLRQRIPKLTLSLKPTRVPSNGRASTTATVTVTAGAEPLSGESIGLTSSDPGETIGPVTDNGDGTYTATITASTTPGTATITASDPSVGTSPSKTAKLRQRLLVLALSLSPRTVPANGQATTEAKVKVSSAGEPLSGESIGLTSSDPGETIGPVTDNGDGTYTATITASTTPGTATITASDDAVTPAASRAIVLKQRSAS